MAGRDEKNSPFAAAIDEAVGLATVAALLEASVVVAIATDLSSVSLETVDEAELVFSMLLVSSVRSFPSPCRNVVDEETLSILSLTDLERVGSFVTSLNKYIV